MQFDTAEQQKDASTLGMWIFLVTEIMFFGGMFASLHRLPRLVSGRLRDRQSTSLNAAHRRGQHGASCCVSSFTMVMAVRAAQLGQRKSDRRSS